MQKEKEVEQSKEKEINDLKNQLEKQKVENQELLDGILDMNNALHDLKNQLAYQKDKLHEKDEALKVNEKNIAELKFSIANEECLKNRLANQRDEIQENLKALEQIKDKEINDLKNQIKRQKEKEKDVPKLQSFIEKSKLAEDRGTSIPGEVCNVEIPGSTQQLLNGKSHDFLAIFALKYGSEEKGSSLCKCSILLGFIMSKNLRGL